MENHIRHALDLLCNQTTSDDWQMLVRTEQRSRIKTNNPTFTTERGCHGI